MWLVVSEAFGISSTKVETHFVNRDPVFDPISQPLEQDLGVRDKVIDHFFTDESAVFILEGVGIVPMEDCYAWGDPFCEKSIDKIRVVLDTFLIDRLSLGSCTSAIASR
jgi:hypothetical protein